MAAAANYLYRRPFPSMFAASPAIGLSLALMLVWCIDREWAFQSPAVDFNPQLMIALGLVIPHILYPVFVMKVLCFALFACAFNLLIGYVGLLSFGHAAYFGMGAYITGHAAKAWGLPPELAILLGGAVGAALGLPFGWLAIRRAGIKLVGSVEVSGTVDEESGGFAGMAWLAQQGRLSADRTDAVIITEPTNTDRIYTGHRGVYWFEVTTRGRIAHGCMPFLGVSAIEHMGVILDQIRRELMPALGARTTAVPVKPDGARHATLNINGIAGGQPIDGIQTPCVADLCRAVFDRRFLVEEGFAATRSEIVELLERAARETPHLIYELRDLMVVHPVRTPDGASVVSSLEQSIQHVLGHPATLAASPGTYDHKHVDRIAGVPNCVAYGPGILDLAHQPDEYCVIEDLVQSTKVLALSLLELTGSA